MITVQRKVRLGQGSRGRKRSFSAGTPTGRIPRVARLMALAIRFDQLIRNGVVADQAELAHLGNVSRARLTQIMNLLQLAPDVQEQIVFLLNVKSGRGPLTERQLRPIAATLDWRTQRRLWKEISCGG